jgi:rhodanese-related sulfurtransferase
VVIDVRTGGDYKSSPKKIPGAVRENPIDVENWAGRYPAEKTIVLYCT